MKKIIIVILFVLTGLWAQEVKQEVKKEESKVGFIQEHRPFFIAFGDNKMNTILQISMKYELIKNTNVFLGYTQFSVWELWKQSSPFRDHNFNPELFWTFVNLKDKYDFTASVGPFEHKSNGRDGDADRTYDSSYVEFEKGLTISKVRLGFNNKLYVLYNMAGNTAIKEYMGFWKTGLTVDFDVPYLDKEQLYINFIPGLESNLSKSTLEAGAKFRTLFGQDFAPYILVQYWRGYLASLLDYNTFGEGIRAGIIIYR